VIDPCIIAQKSVTLPWSDFIYELFEGPIIKSWTDSAASSTEAASLCGDWNYGLTYPDGTTIDGTLFTFSSTDKELAIYTGDPTKSNPYRLTFNAWQGSYLFTPATVDFTITISDFCSTSPAPVIVTGEAYVDQEFRVFNPT